jgi:hypothetical protein
MGILHEHHMYITRTSNVYIQKNHIKPEKYITHHLVSTIWILNDNHETLDLYYMHIQRYTVEHRMYVMWTSHKYNIEHHMYIIWTLEKKHLKHHIYTIWTSQNITQNITCILCEHHKINHRTSYVYYVNITCILREHHKIHHKTSHMYYVNITKQSIKHNMYTAWIPQNTSHVYYVNITCILHEHHKINKERYMYTTWTSQHTT